VKPVPFVALADETNLEKQIGRETGTGGAAGKPVTGRRSITNREVVNGSSDQSALAQVLTCGLGGRRAKQAIVVPRRCLPDQLKHNRTARSRSAAGHFF